MVSNIAGVNQCRKCGHDLSEHDVYDVAAKVHLHLLELSADGSLQLRTLCQEK
jgi:hypothetical protein